MKTNLIVGLLLSLCFSVFAQRVLENPVCQGVYPGLTIEKVVLTDTATHITMTYKSKPNWWFTVDSTDYIRVDDNEEKLMITSGNGLEYGKKYHQDSTAQTTFTCSFPALSTDIALIHLGDPSTRGWYVTNIVLKNGSLLSYMPDNFAENWVIKDNAEWKISFAKKHIIYNGEIYKKFSVTEKKGIYTINLGDKQIYAKSKGNSIFVGEDKSALQECVQMDLSGPEMGVNEYPIPTFKMRMDTAYYRGYLSDYTPKLGKTGAVSINNILSHEQEKLLITIDSSGWFEVNIPMYYAQDVFFRMPNSSYSAFMIPGETLTQFVKDRHTKSLGKYAHFNDEHNSVRFVSRSFNYRKIQNEIENMTIDDYKAYCDTCYQLDLKKWAKFCDEFDYNDQIIEIGKKDIQMIYIQNLWSYSMKQSSHAYKLKKEGQTYDYEEVDSSYYDMLFDLPIDDEAMLSYNSHSSIVNRLEYADWLRCKKSFSMNTEEILSILDENGIELTGEEQMAAKKRDAYLESDLLKDFNEKASQYNEEISKFYRKYYQHTKPYNNVREAQYLNVSYYSGLKEFLMKDTTITLSPDEIQLLDYFISIESEEFTKVRDEFEFKTMKEYSKINNKYTALISQSHAIKRADSQSKKFLDYAGEKGQLLNDIMLSRQICPSTNSLQSLYPSTFKYIDDNIKSPFIRDYIRYSNDKVLEQIELNKTKTGYNVNKVPTTEGEKFFAEMIKPFKGKVIYVDFWATWCGPCRHGMQSIKPLKEELKGRDDIVFLYITNQTSPEELFNNMVPDIKGEHYRVSEDEWNYLTTQFGVTGIPHYMVVDKKGVVVNNNDNISAGSSDLKGKLLKYAAE